MKFSFAILAAAVMAVQASALPAADAEKMDKPPAIQPVQAAAAQLESHPVRCPKALPVEFLRSYHAANTDHFYTTDVNEMNTAATTYGYNREGNAGRVYTGKTRETTPLFRVYSDYWKDHFYTTNPQERDSYVWKYKYTDEGVAGHVFRSRVCGSIPLYRLYHTGVIDHFYTTNAAEVGTAQALGYYNEGIVGFVMP
ncbi:hypothetical protein PC9H_006220 [Pleurotus ostreatus]|uniref:DUF5648 domain-containing protein n=1 Tax=Pleurotus ostreatus TaxID=5322 RepID=A0A8H6ZXJ3_PLEOS|nr:uncharacterized protein PC9H_006220 [Pleurotus ostreatus]KAF7430512.1 hypothetical protein PC9H_006220 [Pleurotus ostreatus]KAJ8694790.1 hypothetical protein PTI98_007439 [Pleurotus ostreatus]